MLAAVVMAVFGISHTRDTKVGSDYIRGVSCVFFPSETWIPLPCSFADPPSSSGASAEASASESPLLRSLSQTRRSRSGTTRQEA